MDANSIVVPAGASSIAARSSDVLNDPRRKLPEIPTMCGTRRLSARSGLRRYLEPGDVWKVRSDAADVFELVEQHHRRVPLALHERVADGRRHRGGERQRSSGDDAGRHVGVDDGFWGRLDQRLQPVDRLVVRREAGNAEYRAVAKENFRK